MVSVLTGTPVVQEEKDGNGVGTGKFFEIISP